MDGGGSEKRFLAAAAPTVMNENDTGSAVVKMQERTLIAAANLECFTDPCGDKHSRSCFHNGLVEGRRGRSLHQRCCALDFGIKRTR